MFERYTEKARRVIFFARYEASQFGSPYIETEHLLLGLLREDQGTANRVERSGTSVESIRKQIEGRTPPRQKVPTSVDLPLSQELKQVLSHAAEEAERLSDKHIGPEHLLLGLLREGGCLAAQILHERGLRLAPLREELSHALAEKTPLSRPKEGSLLSVISRDLTQAARENRLDPLFGRKNELESLAQILCRRTKNNPVLVGEPGVGKRTIVEGLAQRIAEGSLSPRLADKRIFALDLSPVVAVTGESRQLEERVIAVLKELIEVANLIVFIEHLFSNAGVPGRLNTANLLKPLLTQGEIQCIAAAIPGDYRKAIEEEAWLEACFNAVEVRAVDEAEALKILVAIKGRYERFHSVNYTDEAVKYAVYHSQRYIPGRCLPDKAIDLIDEAGAAVALRESAPPQEVIEVQRRLRFIGQRMENALSNREFEKTKFYSEEESKERENLRQLRAKYNLDATSTVTLDDVENVVARWTGVPIVTIRQGRSSAGPGGYGGQAS